MLINTSYVAGIGGDFKESWHRPTWLRITAIVGAILAAAGIFVAVAANHDLADYTGRIIGKNLNVGQLWTGVGMIAVGVLALLSSAVFLMWRHESRHQTQMLIMELRAGRE